MGKKLVVEILSAHNLMPKDGQGSDNAYCMVEFDGQRRTTRVKSKDLNPVWNEKLDFTVNNPASLPHDTVRVEVWTENQKDKFNRRKDGFLGRVLLSGGSAKKQGDENIVSHLLQKRSPFSHVKGELRLKLYYVDDPPAAKAKDASSDKKDDAKKEEKKKGGDQTSESKKGGEDDSAAKSKDGKKAAVIIVQAAAAAAAPTIVPAAEYALKERAPVVQGDYPKKARSYDMVEKMQYLFVCVVKGRKLSKEEPFVVIKFGEAQVARKKGGKRENKVVGWDELFAFSKERIQGPSVEIVVSEDDKGSKDMGSVLFDHLDIPVRVPDSPLAPQWYPLEDRKTRVRKEDGGEIMLAVWWGTQEDESFPVAWQSDTGGHSHTKAKVYLSPRMWYLRVNVIEAQDVAVSDKSRPPELLALVQLGPQKWRSRPPKVASGSPLWNESNMFVAAEPFEEHLVVTIVEAGGKEAEVGSVRISMAGNKQITRRMDAKAPVPSFWYNLNGDHDVNKGEKGEKFKGRVHLRVCLEGGYHVMDESSSHISDTRPSGNQQQWKRSLGVVQVGILQGKSLLPMKTKEGRGSTDAYCVAKYGPKWIRTRTVVDSLNPKWNEQYSWDVFDPCTVITVCVFHNAHLEDPASAAPDALIGKVRIRLSTLESGKAYCHSYPLIALRPSGVKKMGEVEMTVRFTPARLIDVLHAYSQPQLPRLHYSHPLTVREQEILRLEAVRTVAARLGRTEPPLRPEIIRCMLDTESNMFSMRRSKANYLRLLDVMAPLAALWTWLRDVRTWKSPVTTLLVHVLFLILACLPELLLPTLFLYLFLIGAARYRRRPRGPPGVDARLSQAVGEAALSPEELDEEFDSVVSSRQLGVVKARYERLRLVASRVQTVAGDVAAQGERLSSLLSWRDPRATAMFISLCLLLAVLLYVTPFKVVTILLGLYSLRHPRFRTAAAPPLPLNFFRRLPSHADRIL